MCVKGITLRLKNTISSNNPPNHKIIELTDVSQVSDINYIKIRQYYIMLAYIAIHI